MSDFKLSGNNFDSVEEDISTLKELFPSIVTGDNEIDFDELREIFEKNGEAVVDDTEEHYKFTWWGKKEAKRIAKESTTKTLRPSKKDSKNWDTTENIYIEGDNLEALKILLGSYRNSIKMIYIDPPYNTGKDFVYKDNRTETEKKHLESTDQLSEEGFLFENARTDGKYHSNWLNMIYPRLVISRKLLTDDGFIFISIDNNEYDNLKKICDEIFGEENFIASLIRQTRKGGGSMSKYISSDHDYILVFSKNISKLNRFYIPYDENYIKRYKNEDEKGKYFWDTFARNRQGSSNSYVITAPDGQKLTNSWIYKEDKYKKLLDEGEIRFKKLNNTWSVQVKQRINNQGQIMRSLINDYTNEYGTKEINELLGKEIFSYVKPVGLIKHLIFTIENKDEIILDFFSGSATTAQSVMEFNNENNTNHKFIMVQIPEKCEEKSKAYKAGYKNICEIGEERIRRAGDKILGESNKKDLDIGFKVFKVDESNFIPWNPIINQENVEQAILSTGNNIVDGRSELDLIYELLLKLNMELTCSIENEIINNHKIYIIDEGYALICLDSNIDESIANDLVQLKQDLLTEHCEVILRDDALDDNSAINIYETLKTNNMEFHTI